MRIANALNRTIWRQWRDAAVAGVTGAETLTLTELDPARGRGDARGRRYCCGAHINAVAIGAGPQSPL